MNVTRDQMVASSGRICYDIYGMRIARGTHYVATAYADAGDIWTFRLCPVCREVEKHVVDCCGTWHWYKEGLSPDEYYEWADDAIDTHGCVSWWFSSDRENFGLDLRDNQVRTNTFYDYLTEEVVASEVAVGASWFSPTFWWEHKAPTTERPQTDGVHRFTVKPLTLMRQLVRLSTSYEGMMLDPFAGADTTVKATLAEGMRVIAIECEPLTRERIGLLVGLQGGNG